ncbi:MULTISPECIES: hypothetical protein [Deefgea]|uniref:Lipoprotein n=1 Tax=Deefgea chitinilytica TaxID=570276 RepID=A0ABS2C9M4_9NEIS|nr:MULTISPECIES: hypothetical protein [Deefgea]MBM5570824.1 hypothetical protein [Deefgea chitinilytica]MBM9888053.1 hypothetical protein [Deefgea sp. CFH1-16]
MNRSLYRWYCIAIVTICSLINLSSCGTPKSGSSRGWSSGYSSSGGGYSGSGHK